MTILYIHGIVVAAHDLEWRFRMAANKGPTEIDVALDQLGKLVRARTEKKTRRQRAREPGSPVQDAAEEERAREIRKVRDRMLGEGSEDL